MSVTKFIFIGNGQYQNRGCEAITLGTIEILRKAFGSNATFVDMHYDEPHASPPSWASGVENYEHEPQLRPKRFCRSWWIRNGLRVFPKLRLRYMKYENTRTMRPHIGPTAAILALGGDNYSLDYGIPYAFICHGQFAKEHGVPFFIWGGSVGPFDKNPQFAQVMLEHLRHEVTGVFTREKRSCDYLKEHQVENAWMMSDPAFVMEPEPVSSDQLGFEFPENAIGVNLSPIMRRFCHQGDMEAWRKNARDIILAIRKHFDNPIVLIPHVTIGDLNNDHLFMESCLEGIKRDDRIYSIDGRFNARQTKWLISRLSCLAAARTHATIAAFSTCTPTISLAYSVKAFGLNEMLFGHSDYLVSPEKLCADNVVTVTEKVLEHSAEIKGQLENVMPTTRKNAYLAGEQLKEICNR